MSSEILKGKNTLWLLPSTATLWSFSARTRLVLLTSAATLKGKGKNYGLEDGRILCARVRMSVGGGVGTVGGGGGCGAGSGMEKEVVVGGLWWSHTFLPSQPQTYHPVIMVKMVPYEAFACLCGAADVVLRESYKPKTRGKLYYACPRSSLSKTLRDVNFLWKEEQVRLLVGSPGASTTPIYSLGSSSTPIYSSGSSTPPHYSPGASTTQSYSLGTLRNVECSNCKYLLDKITVLEATVDMYMHPEQHTFNSAALFHEVYNNIGKLDLE
nr:hypothetical protein [Tanacetum cinerariifolium]